jgi:[histone H3]-lysine36 N-dimethyltransferase SETMAR
VKFWSQIPTFVITFCTKFENLIFFRFYFRAIGLAQVGIFEEMSNLEHRAVIKFLTLEGVEYTEIHNRLKNIYKDSAPHRTTVCRWANEFKRGRQSIEDDPRTGRPATAQNEETIDKVQNIVMEDRRIAIEQLADILKISSGSVHTILHDQLRLSKVSARWVPRMLTDVHKQARLNICQQLLDRCADDEDGFFDRIVTGDETWVHYFDPETKRASMEWKHPESPPPRKFKVKSSAGKLLLSVFWDARGVLLIDFLEQGHTITGQYYSNLLVKLRGNIKSQRRGMLRRGVLLQDDNASPHKCELSKKTVADLGFESVPHPPYSPDLAPSDFYLFGKLKEQLRGTHFTDNDELKIAVTDFFEDQAEDFYKTGILSLKHRWQKCVTLRGDYVEK